MSQRLQRLGKLWEGRLSRWVAAAFWLAVLAGAIAVTEGPKWLYASLVFAASCISAWTLLQIVRLYWGELLGWLLSRTRQSNRNQDNTPFYLRH
jgi:hypothetical protein